MRTYPGPSTHEIGHVLGLSHSHYANCINARQELIEDCQVIERGDIYSVMGGGGLYHFNAQQKNRLGWIQDNTDYNIVTIDSGEETIFLSPIEDSTFGIKAIRVKHSSRPNTSLIY